MRTDRELREAYMHHMDVYHRYGEGKSAYAIMHYSKAQEARIELEDRFGGEV